jgi:hypothetical protein
MLVTIGHCDSGFITKYLYSFIRLWIAENGISLPPNRQLVWSSPVHVTGRMTISGVPIRRFGQQSGLAHKTSHSYVLQHSYRISDITLYVQILLHVLSPADTIFSLFTLFPETRYESVLIQCRHVLRVVGGVTSLFTALWN